jgi:hypothetical protein
LQLSNQARETWKPAGNCRENERNQMGRGACCKFLFSLFGVVEFSSFYDDSVPSLASLNPTNILVISPSIKSLILALFNSVLGPKKILQIGP